MKGIIRKIGIDVDGVLLDFMGTMNNFYNLRFGTNFKFEDYLVYDVDKTWKCRKEEKIQIVKDFYLSENFWEILPLGGSQESISRLARDYELIAITMRPSSIQERTKKQIEKYFGDSIKKIISNGQFGNSSSSMDKSEICLQEKIDLFLEDHLGIAYKCAEKQIGVFLMDQPWNQSDHLPQNIIRVKNWPEILEKLK